MEADRWLLDASVVCGDSRVSCGLAMFTFWSGAAGAVEVEVELLRLEDFPSDDLVKVLRILLKTDGIVFGSRSLVPDGSSADD